MGKKPSKPGWIELRALRATVTSQLRCRRECSLSQLVLLLTLAEAGELSTMALVRRIQKLCGANVRQLLHVVQVKHQWIQCRVDEDGKWWTLTEAGWAIVTRAVQRTEEAGRWQD